MRLLLSMLLLCFMSQIHANDSLEITIGAKDRNFQVKLPSNPTTGYQWSVTQFDKNLIQLLSSNYIPEKTNLIGSGGTMIFQFKLISGVKMPQNTSLSFMYARPWEQDKGTLKTVIVNFK